MINLCIAHSLVIDNALSISRQYAAIVFINNNRFETTKKKLAFLSLGDFVHCANLMITNWSFSSKGNTRTYQSNDNMF